MPAKSRACGSGLGSMTLWIIAPQRPHHGMVIDRKVTRPLSTGSLVALKHPQLETDPWERIAGSPRGLESSLKIRLLQNHIWNRVAISCKVFNSIPTRIKQNHPRRTHKKTYLKKWLPMSPCQEAKGGGGGGVGGGKRKHQDSTESSDRHMRPATIHNKVCQMPQQVECHLLYFG